MNEARDAFDVFDNAEGLLAFEDVGKVLDKLGFQDEVGGSRVERAASVDAWCQGDQYFPQWYVGGEHACMVAT